LLNSCNLNNNSSDNSSFCGDATCNDNEDCSSCSADCGVCPENPSPVSSSSGGGGGGGRSPPVTSKATTNTEENSADNINSNNQEPQQNSATNEPASVKEDKKQFSLTGLMVAVQNNSSLKVALVLIIGIGGVAVFFLLRKYKFSKKYVHRNMVKIHKKRK